ncbi:MAG: hypothetical protein E4H15_03930 [Syntrophobacterales bacterium]|nr:MAG: hypothetical protein E4H15_03930 [Syntrophobacterales bacterium]
MTLYLGVTEIFAGKMEGVPRRGTAGGSTIVNRDRDGAVRTQERLFRSGDSCARIDALPASMKKRK